MTKKRVPLDNGAHQLSLLMPITGSPSQARIQKVAKDGAKNAHRSVVYESLASAGLRK